MSIDENLAGSIYTTLRDTKDNLDELLAILDGTDTGTPIEEVIRKLVRAHNQDVVNWRKIGAELPGNLDS